jgi:hypothetical protein
LNTQELYIRSEKFAKIANFPKERNEASADARRPDLPIAGRRIAGEPSNLLGTAGGAVAEGPFASRGAPMVQGIVASESPLVTQIARGTREPVHSVLTNSKRGYRLLANKRLSHRLFLKGLCGIAQRTVADQTPGSSRLVVAIDPVNLEKPYTLALEEVSPVRKSAPPSLDGEARLTRGYPATLVNMPQPAISYAGWFSCRTTDFISQTRL